MAGIPLTSENTPTYPAATGDEEAASSGGDTTATFESADSVETPAATTVDEGTAPVEDGVPLKVKGEEHVVTREEAISLAQQGLHAQQQMKKAAEMQKTLEDQLAQNADLVTIGKSFQSDPAGSVKTLIDRGLLKPEDIGLGASTVDPDDEFLTEEQRELRELRAQVAQVQTTQSLAEQRTALMNDLASLEAKHGSFDRQQLVEHAQANGLLGNLEAAYAHMNLDVIQTGQQAQEAEAARLAALEGKRDAGLVSRGGAQAASAHTTSSVERPSTTEEAVAQALRGEEVDPAVANGPLDWLKRRG